MSKKLIAPLAIIGGIAAGGYFLAPMLAGAGTAGAIGGGIGTTTALNSALASGTGLGSIGASTLAGASSIPGWLSPALTIAGGGFSALSTLQQGQMMKQAGDRDQEVANAQASLLDQNAGQARAASQRTAIEQRRRVGLLSSRARAVAAAGGTSTTDPGVVDAISDLDPEAEYRFRTALAEGESDAQGMEFAAATKRSGGSDAASLGEMQRRSSYMRAGTTVAGSVAPTLLVNKYG